MLIYSVLKLIKHVFARNFIGAFATALTYNSI